MGRAPMPHHDSGEMELLPQGPHWRAGGPATLRLLILALLWRGSLSQLPGFTLTVPQSVSVQEGLCVLVPCTFTYPASYDTDNPSAQLYGQWYKESATVGQDLPVASSGISLGVLQEIQGRFRLTGDPGRSDCSLQISDARRTDAGRYFFSFEKGLLEHIYRSNSDGTDPALTISVLGLTEEPEIQISPALGLPGMLLAGEPVTVICTAPGRCSGPPPRVTLMGPFSDTARNVSAQLANGTWAHSSVLSFTPGLRDHGKELVCTITYRPRGPSTSRTVRLHVIYPPGSPSITRTLTRNRRPVPDAWGAEGDVVSLETQEGDSLILSCEAGSRPEATLSWAKGNESLSPSQGGAGHLELPNLSRGDAGEYRCWAKNSYGSASRVLRVHVQHSPRPGTRLNSSCQRQGPNVSCSCSLRSQPPPLLQWQVDGEPLSGNGSWGALQVKSWAQGDKAISTLSWMGGGDRSHQIFCLGSNPHGFHILLLNPPETGSLTWPFIEISCKLGFVATGFFLAYYLTLFYYRRTLCCSPGSRRKDRLGVRESKMPEFGV